MIQIEVAYAKPEEQLIIPFEVPKGTTAIQAVHKSGMLIEFSDIDAEKCDLGIFGKMAKHDAVLQRGDRVEIYRPLIADPKEVRKQRAAAGKKMAKGGGDATAPKKRA
jgi:putative ubiquitin-RnfH superfamily antitoxin RatB of RatAB toxin-antitoxin module